MNDIEQYITSLCPSLTTFCRNKVSRGKDVAYNEGKHVNCHKAILLRKLPILLFVSDVDTSLPLAQSYVNYSAEMKTKMLRKGCLSDDALVQLPVENDQLIQLLLSIDADQNNVAVLSKSKPNSGRLVEMLKSHLILLENHGLVSKDENNATVFISYNDSVVNNKSESLSSSVEMKESRPMVYGFISNHENLKDTRSAIKIQSVIRGWRSRKHLRHALESAQYHDDELDELLNMELNFQFDTEDIMSEINDFNWANRTSNDNNLAENDHNSSPESKLASSDMLMVYGDHRRRRSSNINNFLLKPSSADFSSAVVTEELGSPRPSTAMTDASDLTVSTSAHTEIDCEEYSIRSHSGYSQSHKGSSESVKEWGISDPKVISMMLKRNKRLKSFEQAKENREKEKGKKYIEYYSRLLTLFLSFT